MVAAGESYDVAWEGQAYVSETGPCSECTCGNSAPSGSFQLSLDVYFSLMSCPSGDCRPNDKGIVPGATPTGTPRRHKQAFSLPFEPTQEVLVVTIE